MTVDVYNVDEEGEVRLSPTRGDIGTRITATLTDRDGAPTTRKLGVGQVGEWYDGMDTCPRDELG